MAKWKCEICGSKFKNFHAQGFDNKIYCPLCFFKKENQELREKFKATNKGLQKAVLKRKKWKYRYQLARCKIKELERIIELCHLDAKETLATINYEQESQQKEFINYLQRGINHYTAYVEAMDNAGPSIYSNEYDNSKIKIAIYKGILQKYKEIVNGSEQN